MLGLKACITTLCVVIMSCGSSKKDALPDEGKPGTGVNSLPASALRPFGRTLTDEHQSLDLVGSASQVGFSFEGTQASVYVYAPAWLNHNYLQYELDGVYQKRVRILADAKSPLIVTASKSGKHTVWIYKTTEAQTGPVIIDSVTGTSLVALERPEQPLIEFIGNSISAGALADSSDVPCGQGAYYDQHNAYMAYGPRVARALGANFMVNSVSGIGIYRNANNGAPMPQVYEKTDMQATSTNLWNFKAYSPKVVSIELGTNDISKDRASFDSTQFVKGYVQFIQLVKSKYGNVQIALLSSPILNSSDDQLLQNCLTAIKKQVDAASPSDKPVALYFFKPMPMHGCSYHPSVDDHAAIAVELTPFFKDLLK
jgi:lysophospholipase L1-like esterase